MKLVALAVLCGLVACKAKDAEEVPAHAVPVAKAAKIDGPSVTPIVTSSITFAVPKDAPWWGEMSFACYAAAIELQPGNHAAAPFTQLSPNVAPAMAAADLDLDHDIAAFGVWGCGEGPCFYSAVTLRHPERLGDMLAKLVPGSRPKQLGKDHFVIEVPNEKGPRSIHVRAVPIAWPGALPTDAWSREVTRATHVVFVTGLSGTATDFDPLTALADVQTGGARVRDTEGVLADAHGRCLVGFVGKRPFQPGFELDHARFGVAAPEGKGDPLTRLVGSSRTLDLEVELALSPTPTGPVVDRWIAEARTFVAAAVAPVRQQLASQGPIVEVMFGLGGLLGDRGFRHELNASSLRLSWRTDRIPQTDLTRYEAQLEETAKSNGTR